MREGKKILYIDMDETICDFSGHFSLKYWDKTQYNPPQMYEKGFFEELQPLPGAISAVIKILNSDIYDVWILTQPVAKSPSSYTEKANWIAKYLPDLMCKIIMTQDKSLSIGDYLIDDNEKWRSFDGKFIHFKTDIHPLEMWSQALKELGV